MERRYQPQLEQRREDVGGKRALCADVKFFQTYEETSGALLATQYKDPPITVTTEETT